MVNHKHKVNTSMFNQIVLELPSSTLSRYYREINILFTSILKSPSRESFLKGDNLISNVY